MEATPTQEPEVLPPETTAWKMGQRGNPTLRPSSLPKLAECPCYTSTPFAGGAAARGTLMDTAFRDIMQGRTPSVVLPQENLDAVMWAADTSHLLAGVTTILTDEQDCRVTVRGVGPGTADIVFPDLEAHGDLKSGQVRNYREQMAGYALAFMDEHFASQWTYHLLFCDQKQVVTETLTYEQAAEIVAGVVARYTSPTRKPRVCAYCSWCAHNGNCEAQLALAVVPHALPATMGVDALLADPVALADFMAGCDAIEEIQKVAKARMLDMLKRGISIPGYKLQTRTGNKYASPQVVSKHLAGLSVDRLAEAYGSMSASKFREVFTTEYPLAEFPENALESGASSTFVTKDKTKPKTQKQTQELN